ncbi:MAG: c-type cytochrome, partial [Cyclobacteriaceae bacterium]
VRLTKNGNGAYEAEEFPVADKIAKLSDVEFGKQGDLYVAQFGTEDPWHKPYKEPMGGIYRFIEAPWVKPDNPETNTSVVFGNIHHGEEIFQERICATCHSVEGSEDLLGPDLVGIGELLSKNEILESIENPNKNIKTGFDQIIVTKNDGNVIVGRIVTANEKEITIMVSGNELIKINSEDIKSREMINSSLMPPGLLAGLTDSEINDLLGYLQSLKMEY